MRVNFQGGGFCDSKWELTCRTIIKGMWVYVKHPGSKNHHNKFKNGKKMNNETMKTLDN